MVSLSALVSLNTCLSNICAGRLDCVAFSGGSDWYSYQINWVKLYNLAIYNTPAAVIRPNSTEEVAAAVQCAADNGYKVQARSGGHSYANFGLGTGELTIDLVNLQQYSMNETTWYATIGAGMKLGVIDTNLLKTGRAVAHGICPSVGIGGHATIGGLGPMSRMWGSMLDHVLEVEVVTANGTILRASEDENSDLFLGLRGAGASFGIITEFVLKTHPTPGVCVQYSYKLTRGSDAAVLANAYMAWQELVADPNLDRRFGTELILWSGGIIITGTFYSTKEAFESSGIQKRLPKGGTITVMGWLGSLVNWAQTEALYYLSDTPTDFYAKSLGFRKEDLLTEENATSLFEYTHGLDKGTKLWFIIFDATGGAVADVPLNATGYAHRDKIFFYQSYAIDLNGHLSNTTRSFMGDFHDELVSMLPPGDRGAYPGYVDLDISGVPQEQYWEGNLPTLEGIKLKWDPDDIFHNPQSVQPAAA